MNSIPGLQADVELALRSVRAAGAAVLEFFRRDTPVDFKSPDQPVTEADLTADRLLHENLVGQRPEYGWLSEETADSPERLARERVWIVDPLDGTSSFVDGFAEYAISVGLAVGGEAAVGVVYNPSTGELFHAVRGAGAFLNGSPLQALDRAGTPTTLVASRSEIRRGHFRCAPPSWRLVPLGSTAYKMVKTLDGTADGYLSRGPKSEWDVCAAALIVREAGGTATDLRGSRLQFNRPEPYVHGIIAGTTATHERLLRLVPSLPPLAGGPTAGSP